MVNDSETSEITKINAGIDSCHDSKYQNKNKERNKHMDQPLRRAKSSRLYLLCSPAPSSNKVRKPGVVPELKLKRKLNLHREFNHCEQVIMINHTK